MRTVPGWVEALIDWLIDTFGREAPDASDDEDDNDVFVEVQGPVEIGHAAPGGVMTSDHPVFQGFMPGFFAPDPSTIPDDAKSAKWEAFHLFSPYDARPRRGAFGLEFAPPPLAMVCPDCDLKQPAMMSGQRRKCRYCGVILHVHGTRLYWWRP